MVGDVHPSATNLDQCPAEEFRQRVLHYDILDPEDQEKDFFPFFNRLREEFPIARAEGPRPYWLVSRYEDVRYVLSRPDLFSSRRNLYPFMADEDTIAFNMDPPEQMAYHRALALALSREKVETMVPVIRRHARENVDAVLERGRCELMSEFATPMMLNALLECCGLSSERLSETFNWVSEFFTKGRGANDPEVWAEYGRRRQQAEDYIAEIIEQRKGANGTDPLSELSRSDISGRPVTDDELRQMASFTVLAGVDTTATTTCNIMAWLAEHPDRRAELVARPELIPSAVEEFMRYESINSNGRIVTEDTELHGVELKAGDAVMMVFPATGRDPRVFDEPEELQFDRSPNPHLGFGWGIHRCVGINLARAEVRVALEEWHARIPEYHVDPDDRIRRRRGHIAGVWHLPVVIG
jgi:cytochrome P450